MSSISSKEITRRVVESKRPCFKSVECICSLLCCSINNNNNNNNINNNNNNNNNNKKIWASRVKNKDNVEKLQNRISRNGLHWMHYYDRGRMYGRPTNRNVLYDGHHDVNRYRRKKKKKKFDKGPCTLTIATPTLLSDKIETHKRFMFVLLIAIFYYKT